MTLTLRFLVASALLLSAPAGCANDSAPPPMEGGVMTACAPSAIVPLTFPMGPTPLEVMAAGNTAATGVPSSLVPMTPNCVINSRTGPEIVFQVTIPGTGPYQLHVSTEDPATEADTVVYVQTQCGGTELGCNDDASREVIGPSALSVDVMGGQTYYIVVDSEAPLPEAGTERAPGPFALKLTLREEHELNAPCDSSGQHDVCVAPLVCTPPGPSSICGPGMPPKLDAAEAFYFDDGVSGPGATGSVGVMLYVSGSDVDGDVNAIRATFRTASGPIQVQSDVFTTPYLSGLTTFLAIPRNLLPVPMPMAAQSVDVTLIDSTHMTSGMMNTPLRSWKNNGAVCNATLVKPDECAHDLVCVAGGGTTACGPSAAVVTACNQAQLLSLPATTLGTLGMPAGSRPDLFEGSCVYVPGGLEDVYRVTVPTEVGALAHDLIASTEDQMIDQTHPFPAGSADTYLYVRKDCSDATRGTSELGCNDDVNDAAGDLYSRLEVRDLVAQDYYVIVDTSQGYGGRHFGNYKLMVRLRKVLDAGAPCDPTGTDTRCTGTLVCRPASPSDMPTCLPP